MGKDGVGSPKAGVFNTYENENDRDETVTKHKDTAVDETSKAGDKASEGSRSLEQQQHGTDKEYLDKNVNANQAKGEGQYGHINNRDYRTTLKLARDVDRYNSRPMGHMFMGGAARKGHSIPTDLGTGYDKPKLETMESRAMQQSFELDTNQKKLAQALQDAVNHKDLEAFQQLYKQLYGIELSKMDAEMEMIKMTRTAQITDTISRRTSEWTTYLGRAVNAQTAATIASAMRTDEVLANMLGWILGNGAQTLSQDEALRRKYQNDLANQMQANGINKLDAAQASSMIVTDSVMQYQMQLTDMVRDTNSIYNRGYNYLFGSSDFRNKYSGYYQ